MSDNVNGAPNPPPGFDEPWQAQAHAMVQVLLDSGKLEANAWSQSLGAAIRERLASGSPDTTQTYYGALTDALTSILSVDAAELGDVIEAWRAAFETTPHGKPVHLEAK
ncbi:MAG: hypothetical protein ACI915_002187 [Gammaproteobacteria bacterium]|jgi:hypothetical protein